jgi:hypothetical protein
MQVKSKVKIMLIIFFDIKRIVHKELFRPNWQAKQSIPHTTVPFYGDCMKMCEDFNRNFGDKTGCCIKKMRRFTLNFSPGNFYQK